MRLYRGEPADSLPSDKKPLVTLPVDAPRLQPHH